MSDEARIVQLREVLAPGERCSYTDLISRLKDRGFATDGIGAFLERFRYQLGSRTEFVTWMRDVFWDDEWQGGWNKEGLWIMRSGS